MAEAVAHGTEAAWRAGCRKYCCQRPHERRRDKARKLALVRGADRRVLVDVEPVRKHIETLIGDFRHTRGTISEASELTFPTIVSVQRKTARIDQRTADKILGIPLAPPWEITGVRRRTLRRVPARGSIRRLRALSALGYTAARTAAGIGSTPRQVRFLLRKDEGGWVSGRTATDIVIFYRKALLVSPPQGRKADRERRIAAFFGWHGPGYWEDPDHDTGDPREDHDEVVDFVRERPDMTTTDLGEAMRDEWGMPITVFRQLVREAFDAGKIKYVQTGRYKRIHVS